MIVGTIVKLKRECLDNPPQTKGVCYEVYNRGRGEEGASIIFENGKFDGFSSDEQKEIIVPIGIDENLMNYKFKNVGKLTEDFKAGLFNTSLVPKSK